MNQCCLNDMVWLPINSQGEQNNHQKDGRKCQERKANPMAQFLFDFQRHTSSSSQSEILQRHRILLQNNNVSRSAHTQQQQKKQSAKKKQKSARAHTDIYLMSREM